MRDGRWPGGALLAEFADADGLRRAASSLLDAGQAGIEIYSPYPLEDVARRLETPRSRLPLLVLVGGIVGAIVSYAVQWYANVQSYPLRIGGRPAHAVPAFMVATFEGTILFAAVAGFVGVLLAMGLPRLWHPVFEIEGFERVSVDRFWIGVDAAASVTPVVDLKSRLEALGALRVVMVGSAR